MDNPLLVEEYPREYGDTQFEKIKVTAKRAKDLHNAQKTPLVDSTHAAAAYIALEEYNQGKIKTVYKQEEPPPMIARDAEDGEDEE